MRDKPDANAAELLDALTKMGWVCQRIAKAKQRDSGIPDAMVARKGANARTHLVEIKARGGRYSEAQVLFARLWPACVHWGSSAWELSLLLEECEART